MADQLIQRNSVSVYRHANAVRLDEATNVAPVNAVIFRTPERISFEDMDDTIIHIAYADEYLWDIAAKYYKHLRWTPLDLAEILAQFQPAPIVDYSTPLPAGLEVYIPSEEFIEDVVLGPSLTESPEL